MAGKHPSNSKNEKIVPEKMTAPAMKNDRMSSPYSLMSIFQLASRNAGLLFIGLIILVVGFSGGSLWTENQYLKRTLQAGGNGVQIAQAGQAAGGAGQGGQVAGAQASAQPAAAAPAAPANPAMTMDQIKGLFTGSDNIIKFGDPNGKLVFVEYSDPSCPYCHIASGKDPELNKQAGDQFKLVADGGTYDAPVEEMRKLVDQGKAAFVYKYTLGHGAGRMGAEAQYCANEQGKFWPVHDLLMSNAGYNLQNNTVKNDHAQSQALADFLKPAIDPAFMKTCLDSAKYDKKLDADQAQATSIGVNGTPAFFVNATVFPGAYNWKDMQSAVDKAAQS